MADEYITSVLGGSMNDNKKEQGKFKSWLDSTFKVAPPEEEQKPVQPEPKQERVSSNVTPAKPSPIRQQRTEPKVKTYPSERAPSQVVPKRTTQSQYTTAPAPTVSPVPQNVKPFKPVQKTTVNTFNPQSLEEAKVIMDFLNKGSAVLINLEANDKALSQRIVDVVTGALYILDGTYTKITEDIYLMAPKGVEIDSSMAASGSKSDAGKNAKSSEFTFRK